MFCETTRVVIKICALGQSELKVKISQLFVPGNKKVFRKEVFHFTLKKLPKYIEQ